MLSLYVAVASSYSGVVRGRSNVTLQLIVLSLYYCQLLFIAPIPVHNVGSGILKVFVHLFVYVNVYSLIRYEVFDVSREGGLREGRVRLVPGN